MGPGFLMTRCGSLPPSPWGPLWICSPPTHTDPLVFPHFVQATSRPAGPGSHLGLIPCLIRGSQDWSDGESKWWGGGGGGNTGGGDGDAKKTNNKQSFLSHTVIESSHYQQMFIHC